MNSNKNVSPTFRTQESAIELYTRVTLENAKAKAQLRRFGTSVQEAKKLEANRKELVQLAQKPEGTEARKALKKLMTHTYKAEPIPSNDWSDKVSQRSAKSCEYRERGERTCRPSSKTDIKVNSYFKSKSSTPKGVK